MLTFVKSSYLDLLTGPVPGNGIPSIIGNVINSIALNNEANVITLCPNAADWEIKFNAIRYPEILKRAYNSGQK